MGTVQAPRGLSLWLLALASCSARGSVETLAPSVEAEQVLIGKLPKIAEQNVMASPKQALPEPSCFDGAEERELIPVECSPTCTGHDVFVRYCVDGRWNSKTVAANCALCPAALPPALAACRIDRTTIAPSELSLTDGCKLELDCGNERLRAECDGENDGTNTSLCECERNGAEVRTSNPVRGEAPEACLHAAEKCLAVLRSKHGRRAAAGERSGQQPAAAP